MEIVIRNKEKHLLWPEKKWLIHHYPWPNTKWSVLRCMRVWEGNHHSPYQFNRFITFFMNCVIYVLISFETHYNIILSLWLFSHFATLISIISVLKIGSAEKIVVFIHFSLLSETFLYLFNRSFYNFFLFHSLSLSAVLFIRQRRSLRRQLCVGFWWKKNE